MRSSRDNLSLSHTSKSKFGADCKWLTCMFSLMIFVYRVSKKSGCWSHGAQAQSPVADNPLSGNRSLVISYQKYNMIKRFQVMAMGKSLAPKHLILVKIFFCKFLYFGTPCLSSRMLPAYSVIRSDFLWNGCSFASHGAGARIVRVHLWKGFNWMDSRVSIEAISFVWESCYSCIMALS